VTVKDVLQFGNPALRECASNVEDFESASVKLTICDLEDTLHDLQRIHRKGGGLAAPQIGLPTKIVYLNARGRSFHLVNPKIVEHSDEMFEVWDFCFSAKASFLARVPRHRRITVEYQDEEGNRHKEEFVDYFSELLQHEIDHLHGRLFIDLIEHPETIMMAEEWGRTHNYRLDQP